MEGGRIVRRREGEEEASLGWTWKESFHLLVPSLRGELMFSASTIKVI